MTPMKAIRAKCLDCCCGQVQEVRRCPCEKCPLWAYRFGKRPTSVITLGDGETPSTPHAGEDFGAKIGGL